MAKWIPYNPNPSRNRVDDCMLRAICAVTGADWKTVHVDLCALSYSLDDVQVGNFGNIGTTIIVQVPWICRCASVSVRNTSTQAITLQNANMAIDFLGISR